MPTIITTPAIGESVVGGGQYEWIDPQKCTVQDDDPALCAPLSPGLTHQLRGRNYAPGVPAGATIDGVAIRARVALGSSPGGDYTVQLARLLVGGVLSGADKAAGQVIPVGAYGNITFGGPTDKWGIPAISPADVNGANFGFAFQVAATDLGIAINCDVLEATFYYTGGPAPGGDNYETPITFQPVEPLVMPLGFVPARDFNA